MNNSSSSSHSPSVTSLRLRALEYKELSGFSVIPVGKDKRPLLASWKEYQTRLPSDEEIASWWKKWPKANIGIVTGAVSGITVVDVDVHKGGDPSPFPKTYTVRTGNGGLQLYYAYHKGLTVSANAYPDMPAVDIRNDGGFVVAPPSVTDYLDKGKKKGGPYELIDAAPFAAFPAHLFPERKERRPFSDKLSVSAGSRNDSMASLIGTLLLSLKEERFATDGWEAAVAVNRTYDPPLPQDELRTVFTSIAGKESARRREMGNAKPSPIQLSDKERMDIFLRKNGNGVPYKDMTNALMVLSQHPLTKGKIRYNEFRQDVEYLGKPLDDGDILSLVLLMQRDAGLPNISKETVYSAIQRYAYENRYDEAKDWLRSLNWDGTPRLATWLMSALGIEDDAAGYHRGVGSQWMKGLVERLLHPGCVFDYVLVIIGAQGIGKTSLFRILGGPWYKSFTGTVENKDFFLLLRGAAIVDLDEGVALYRSESIKMKSIITQVEDEYRAPYDRVMKKFPRRFVFSMSTNDTEPLRDLTGNRRYWIVDAKDTIDFKWLTDNREQLFAEAYHAVVNGLKLPEVPLAEALDRQEMHLPQDEWTEAVVDYLEQSDAYCTGDPKYETTVTEIYEKVLKGHALERLERKHEIRIGRILHGEGGLRKIRTMIEGRRFHRYVLTEKRIKELSEKPIVPRESKEDKEFSDFTKKAIDIF